MRFSIYNNIFNIIVRLAQDTLNRVTHGSATIESCRYHRDFHLFKEQLIWISPSRGYPVTFTAIAEVVAAFAAQEGLAVGGQDVYPAEKGAFTGEISPAMLADAGASWVLTGHSERRHVLGESDELVGRKTAFALAAGLHVMLCIGETLEEREAGQLEDVLRRQLQTGLADVSPDAAARVAVAYEPVWAIGTGKVAGSAEVLEAHALARRLLVEVLGTVAHDVPLLYGGSVKPDNAASLLALDNVNGLLIGGASLEAESFLRIAGAR